MVLIVHNESVISIWFGLHINQISCNVKGLDVQLIPGSVSFPSIDTAHNVPNTCLSVLSSASMTERKKQKFRKEEIKRMILRITNKTVSFISCPFESYVDKCCFQDIKQLFRLAVITNV